VQHFIMTAVECQLWLPFAGYGSAVRLVLVLLPSRSPLRWLQAGQPGGLVERMGDVLLLSARHLVCFVEGRLFIVFVHSWGKGGRQEDAYDLFAINQWIRLVPGDLSMAQGSHVRRRGWRGRLPNGCRQPQEDAARRGQGI
jgi:hypothetical protein